MNNRNNVAINYINIFLLSFYIFSFAGCASTKNFNHADKERLKKISIEFQNVKFIPSKEIVFLNTDTRGWTSGLFGPIGAIAYEGMHDDSPEEAIMRILVTGDMLKKTVSESFRYQFENAGLFSIVPPKDSDAYLEVEVKDIQLHEMNGDKLKYTGLYFARIFDSKNGALLWAQHDFFSAFNKSLIEYELSEYISDPGKLRYAVSILSQMLATEFIKKLNGNPIAINYKLHSIDSFHAQNSRNSENEEPDSSQLEKNVVQSEGNASTIQIEEKLESLKRLYENEMITKEEYDLKRKEYVDKL